MTAFAGGSVNSISASTRSVCGLIVQSVSRYEAASPWMYARRVTPDGGAGEMLNGTVTANAPANAPAPVTVSVASPGWPLSAYETV